MKGKNVPDGAQYGSFSEPNERRTDTPASRGCEYETPRGRCGDEANRVNINGTRVVLCDEHAEAVAVENGLARGAA